MKNIEYDDTLNYLMEQFKDAYDITISEKEKCKEILSFEFDIYIKSIKRNYVNLN
jgi:predicted nucleic acid-binding protein